MFSFCGNQNKKKRAFLTKFLNSLKRTSSSAVVNSRPATLAGNGECCTRDRSEPSAREALSVGQGPCCRPRAVAGPTGLGSLAAPQTDLCILTGAGCFHAPWPIYCALCQRC